VYYRGRSALLLSPIILLMLLTAGCALIHTAKVIPDHPSQPAATNPASTAKKQGFFYHITHPLAGFHLFAHKPPPPKALALKRIGTIRTLSQDGTYVIVELEPGVLVPPGADLMVSATGSDPARLKVSDVQPPYFSADIVSGNPGPGDSVQQ
jgi:hypothetical protein